MNSLVKALPGYRVALAGKQAVEKSTGIAFLHISAQARAGQDWRKERHLPLNPNKYGPFADSPDYTYLDGRPTPLGNSRLKRALKQREFTKKIVQFSQEMDFAVELNEKRKEEEAARKKRVLERKLKPKGMAPSERS